MPIYEYRTSDKTGVNSCSKCIDKFEAVQKMSDEPIALCPACGNPVVKLISRFSIGVDFDSKAKETGLHKLVRRDKGVYEKMY